MALFLYVVVVESAQEDDCWLQVLLLVVLWRGCRCPVVVPGSGAEGWSVLVRETVQLSA